MPSGSGQKEPCALISYVTKDSCKLTFPCSRGTEVHKLTRSSRGAIGAWIKNVEGPPEDAVETDPKEELDLSKMDLTKLELRDGHADGDKTPT